MVIKRCPVCNSKRIVSNGLNKFACEKCGYVFMGNSSLNKFLNKKQNEKDEKK